MSDVTQSAAEIVNDKYDRSIELADAATEAVEGFQEALNNSVYKPATVSVKWETLAAPELVEVPDMPAVPAQDLVVPDAMPAPLTADMAEVTIDEFTGVAPTLDFGVAPELTLGAAPTIPAIREVAIPDAPDVTLPDAPAFLALSTHAAPSINLREEWLAKLKDIPELTIVQPAPFAYSPGARYASQLLEQLKATLQANLAGGTGLSQQVEAGIWGRDLDRETALALGREQEALRGAEALGFTLPSGVLVGQLYDSTRQKFDQLAARSREIAIEQARLEQTNRQNTLQTVLQLETVLMDDAYKLEQLAFQAAKEAADNAITVHNARLEHFKTLLEGYRSYASVYDTLIKAELSKVQLFEAMLASEKTKADINQSLVARYKAEIEGRMAAVEIFKARVGAAQTLVELERARIQAGAEQVKAFVATINGETAKAELYKVRLDGEKTKMEVFGETVKAYGAKVGAQAEKARAEVAKYQALISAKELEWNGWRARLSAAVAVVEANAKKAGMIVDGYRIGAYAAEARANAQSRRWESNLKQYEAGMNVTFQAAKINAEAVQHANDARMEAAKVGLTTGSQRLASAWSMVSASAQISGTATLSQTV